MGANSTAWNSALNTLGSNLRTAGLDMEARRRQEEADRIAALERDYLKKQRDIAEEERLKKAAAEEETKKNQGAFYNEAKDMFANGVPIESRTSKNYAETMGLSMPDHGTRAPTEQDMLNLAIKHKQLGDNPNDALQKFYLNQTKNLLNQEKAESLDSYRNLTAGVARQKANDYSRSVDNAVTKTENDYKIKKEQLKLIKEGLAIRWKNAKTAEDRLGLIRESLESKLEPDLSSLTSKQLDEMIAKEVANMKTYGEGMSRMSSDEDKKQVALSYEAIERLKKAQEKKAAAAAAAAAKTPPAAAPSGGLTPEQRKRLEELRAKKAAGKL